MNTIYISINNLIAAAQESAMIVSENNGYQIEFTFDDDWDDYTLKTAVFVWYRDSLPYCQTVPFSGNTVEVPQMPAVGTMYVGVTAGNLQTTTPAQIECRRSILSSGGEEPEAPSESVYAQLMELLNATQGASAYELAVYHGYTGSETQWLESLKGETGPQGEQGIQGEQGPQGEQGIQGERGIQGEQGPQGETGPAGTDGSPGADGYTPVRGTDYWTDADKSGILSECREFLAEELANRTQIMPGFANDISECADTGKLYVLPDGYLYAYVQVTANLGDGTNLADCSSSDWLTDQRMSMESAIYSCEGALVTNYIPVSAGDVVRVYNLDMVNDLTNYPNTPKSGCYDADKNELFVNVAKSGSDYWTYVLEDDVAVITVIHADAAYMRFCGEPYDGYTAGDIVITVNEKEVAASYQWVNTGHAFVVTESDGSETVESGENAHAEGYKTTASGANSHAEGNETMAKGDNAHAEGSESFASGPASHAEGYGTKTGADARYAHAEGEESAAYGRGSHAEGYGTVASEDASYSHAEGSETKTFGYASHAEGDACEASSSASHAEGYGTCAEGSYSHAEGEETTASGDGSHAEGYDTTASGSYSHAEGEGTIAGSFAQHVQGKWNRGDYDDQYAHIIGNGSDGERSNAHTVDWDGNAWYAGTVESTGLILLSPGGKRFLVTVDDNGALSAAEIAE